MVDLYEDVKGALRDCLKEEKIELLESKNVGDWWEKLPGKRRKKVVTILGLDKNTTKKIYSKIDADERSEIEAYYSKHKGRVESLDYDVDLDLSEGSMSAMKKVSPDNMDLLKNKLTASMMSSKAKKLQRYMTTVRSRDPGYAITRANARGAINDLVFRMALQLQRGRSLSDSWLKKQVGILLKEHELFREWYEEQLFEYAKEMVPTLKKLGIMKPVKEGIETEANRTGRDAPTNPTIKDFSYPSIVRIVKKKKKWDHDDLKQALGKEVRDQYYKKFKPSFGDGATDGYLRLIANKFIMKLQRDGKLTQLERKGWGPFVYAVEDVELEERGDPSLKEFSYPSIVRIVKKKKEWKHDELKMELSKEIKKQYHKKSRPPFGKADPSGKHLFIHLANEFIRKLENDRKIDELGRGFGRRGFGGTVYSVNEDIELDEAKGYKNDEQLMAAIKKAITKHMPPGALTEIYSKHSFVERTIHITTVLEPDIKKVPYQIIHNDRALQRFIIYGINDDRTLKDKLRVEIVLGGKLVVKPDPGSHLAFGKVKFGWRKKTGTPEQIVKHFDNYYAKVKRVIQSNKKNIPEDVDIFEARLKVVKIGSKKYYRDDRLKEYRCVDDPHNRISFKEAAKKRVRPVKEDIEILSEEGHHYYDGKNYYVDTAFMNAIGGIMPGMEMRHLGFGEFVLDGGGKSIDFDRIRGKKFKGQSGRSHQIYDNQKGALVKKLIKAMEKKGKSKLMKESIDFYEDIAGELRERVLGE